uniref:MADF domain-containing protein n=1 Tax=Meloidogyne javanica TaxID=6303 RepID=A0A915N699_MELJA
MSAKIDINLFIEMIQQNELIWRKGHGEHKDKNKSDKIWLLIAEQCGFDDVKSAKQKWKHLCDYYSKLKKPKASGSDGKDVKWTYLNSIRIDSIQTAFIPNDVRDLLNSTISMSSSDDETDKNFTRKLPSKRRRISDSDKDDAVDNCIIELAKQIKENINDSSPNKQFGLIELKSKRGVSPEEQLIICLRFFATGMQYRALEYSFRALDGKLVRLRKPNNSGSLYHDYKHNFSLNMLALCDYRYRILYVDDGEYGYKGDAN